MSDTAENPFAILGIAPTRDQTAVKKAWMLAAKRHPPNSDPLGFQMVRSAYEMLSTPERLHAAYLAVPFDPADAHAELLIQDQAVLEELQQLLASERAERACKAQNQLNPKVFAQTLSRYTCRDWRTFGA